MACTGQIRCNMNRNLVSIALILLAGAAGILLVSLDRPADTDQERPANVAPVAAVPPHPQEPGPDVSADKKRIAAMRAEYARLEQARDTVRLQLGRLKARTWKLQVAPDQARTIQDQMRQGYAMLKNPPMLGAFSNADEIRRELAKVTRIAEKLGALETTVQEYIAAREAR